MEVMRYLSCVSEGLAAHVETSFPAFLDGPLELIKSQMRGCKFCPF